MVADNPNLPTPPCFGSKSDNELVMLRTQVEKLTAATEKAQQHALELAAQEVRLRAEIEQLRSSQFIKWPDHQGILVWDESKEEVRKRYGDVRIELVGSISSHPPLNEYRVWPIWGCARHNPAGGNYHVISHPGSNNPAGDHSHKISHHEPIYLYALPDAPHDSCRSRYQDLNELFGRFGPIFCGELIEALNKMIPGGNGELVITPVDGSYRCIYRDLVDDF